MQHQLAHEHNEKPNRYDWYKYRENAIDLIGEKKAYELRDKQNSWFEVYQKARKIKRKQAHQALRSEDQEAYKRNVDEVYQQQSYNLIGQELADILKLQGREWYQVYDKALLIC